MRTRSKTADAAERNPSQSMIRLLEAAPPPLAPIGLTCGTQLSGRFTRATRFGYAPAMPGHLIGTYYGASRPCAWTVERSRLSGLLQPNTVTVVPEKHDGYWEVEGPLRVSHVYLTHQRLEKCATLVGGSGKVELLRSVGAEDPVASHILAVLSDANVVGDPGTQMLVDRAVDLLCLQLLRAHSTIRLPENAAPMRGGLARWQLRRVTEYMLEHLERPVGLEELAALVGLSRYHFCTAFRLSTGRTPHVWLTEQRMALARRLLADPHMSVSEIALSVGYSTPSAFAASFRRIVGTTPRDFRRAL